MALSKAKVDAAKAKLTSAELQLSFTRIVSPIDGKIGRSHVDPANLVQADTTVLTTIFSIDPMYVGFDVPEKTILQLHQMQGEGKLKRRDFELPVAVGWSDQAGYPHQGKLALVNSARRFINWYGQVAASIANTKDLLLLPGMYARVRSTTSEPRNAFLVPRSALMYAARAGVLSRAVPEEAREYALR